MVIVTVHVVVIVIIVFKVFVRFEFGSVDWKGDVPMNARVSVQGAPSASPCWLLLIMHYHALAGFWSSCKPMPWQASAHMHYHAPAGFCSSCNSMLQQAPAHHANQISMRVHGPNPDPQHAQGKRVGGGGWGSK
eukprot:8987374-Karenia_brevis.AAC.1